MARRTKLNPTQSDAARQSEAKRECPHCGDGRQTFQFLRRLYLYDIDRARELVLDGREAMELEPDDVRYSVETCHIYEEHLDHVDTQYPGIIAHFRYPMPDGTVERGHILIDGHHRAARCLRDGLPFFVHILNEDESELILLEKPNIEEILAHRSRGQAPEAQLVASV